MSNMSNYPNGFANGLTVRGVPITILHPGKVFYVNSTAVLASTDDGVTGVDSTAAGTYQRPFATLDYAIGQCTASRGDIIALMPGHTETISAASGITSDVAGVAVVGLGSGTLIPTITLDTADTASHVISAANCSFYNVKWVANFADIAQVLNVSGVDGLSFDKCVWTDTSTILNAVDVINLATGADDISFTDCRWVGKSTNNDQFITGVAHDGFFMTNCHMQSDVAQATPVGLVDSSGNVTNARIKGCFFRSNVDAALFLDFNGGANSGSVENCYFSSLDVADATSLCLDFTGGHAFECYASGEAGTWGIVAGGTGAYVNT